MVDSGWMLRQVTTRRVCFLSASGFSVQTWRGIIASLFPYHAAEAEDILGT